MPHREDAQIALAIASVALGTAGIAYAVYAKGQGPPSTGLDVDFVVSGPDGPIDGAVVQLGSAVSVTSTSGVAAFQGVTAGSYSASVTALGYNPVNESVTVATGATSFTVTMTKSSTCSGSCPCGQVWDPITCSCTTVKPASLDITPNDAFSQNWTVQADSFNRTILAGGLSVSPCPGGCSPPAIGPDTIYVDIPGVVRDAAGNPVCGVEVDASLNLLQSSPWSIRICDSIGDCYTWTGYIAYSLQNASAVSDANGAVVFTVAVQFVLDPSTIQVPGLCLNCSCTAQGNFNFPFALYTSIPSVSSIKAVTSITMESLICAYGVV